VDHAPLIFIEFDDVLAETRLHRLMSLRSALAVDGVALSDDVFETQCTGISFAGAARVALRAAGVAADATALELVALRADRAFGTVAARGLSLAPGARDFVRNAAGAARLGLVTRAARRDVDLVLSMADLSDAFECVVVCEDYEGPEPSPTPFDTAVFRMASRQAVTIGDGSALVASLNAVAAARAALLQPVVVGPVTPSLAYAGDGYLASLVGVDARDVVRLAANSRSR
jgi:phosphoglycolate phosphatase-like HAD superfamily hydrolase